MRTKLISIGLAIVFMAASFNMAFADRPTPGDPPGRSGSRPTPKAEPTKAQNNSRFELFGEITAKGTLTFTVATPQEIVEVAITSTTRYQIPAKRNATFADLAVGNQVSVKGIRTADGRVALQVNVVSGKPTLQLRVGRVTEYTGSSITIQDPSGRSQSYVLTSDTAIRNPKGTGVAVGNQVTVISRRDPGATTFVATGIVVHPE